MGTRLLLDGNRASEMVRDTSGQSKGLRVGFRGLFAGT